MSEHLVLEGFISIAAALEAQSRPVHAIYIREDKRDADALKITRRATASGVPVERVDMAVIAAHTSGTSHGGIIALAGERQTLTLASLLESIDRPFIIMLDGVEDPFNYGQAIRAFYAAGAHGLVVRPRSWMSTTGIVARASAGAAERIRVALAQSAEEAAAFYREHGLTIAVADAHRAISIYEADLTVPLFLLVGGEKRGVTRSFADKADLRLKIPYG
ncbi:MAG: RNA methyltransferase, partial [Anaerolineae bacterium]|nr:RNA methyltransferase [Anaerolineae bacterium]